MRFPVALVILYAGSAAFAALTVPGKEREQLRAKDYSAFAAAQGIDLSKMPAWEPIAALNFTPIITGDGLPTLQDLNLTWADIMKPVGRTSDSGRFYCKATQPVSRGEAEACLNYIGALPGGTVCAAPPQGSWSRWCQAGNTAWDGESKDGYTRSTLCVGGYNGGVWILNNCVDCNNGNPIYYEGVHESSTDSYVVARIRPASW
ncbi:hypothetical protein DFP72DRAFT_906187 [Ephemerocybe angulata]|uniref:Secreted protein n=1 Tax=Ephemerocybe angulata TaxID=980116 RepID=A0A8H6HTP2_9AGAR|nr:hypothetical protein DFP72DRAFT_906187 [Tulosesus angulatus]